MREMLGSLIPSFQFPTVKQAKAHASSFSWMPRVGYWEQFTLRKGNKQVGTLSMKRFKTIITPTKAISPFYYSYDQTMLSDIRKYIWLA